MVSKFHRNLIVFSIEKRDAIIFSLQNLLNSSHLFVKFWACLFSSFCFQHMAMSSNHKTCMHLTDSLHFFSMCLSSHMLMEYSLLRVSSVNQLIGPLRGAYLFLIIFGWRLILWEAYSRRLWNFLTSFSKISKEQSKLMH